MKVAFVTGSGAGLGYATCKHLALLGYTVIASMRKLGSSADELVEWAKDEETSIVPMQCDVTDKEQVRHCIEEVYKTYGRLDTLVCNAGAGFAKPLETAEYEEMERIFAVNYWGVVYPIKQALPIMRGQNGGHILVVSSVGGLIGQPLNEIYCSSKFAVEGLVESLSTYMEPAFNVHFTLVEPGGIQSNFMRSAVASSQTDGQLIPDNDYRKVVEAYLRTAEQRAGDSAQVYQSADEVAQVITSCVQAEDPPLRIRTSDWSEQFCRFKTSVDQDGKKAQANVRDMMLAF